MNPELESLKREVETLKQIVNFFVLQDRYIFKRNIELFNGQNMVVGASIGTKIGTATTQKLSVYGVTPVVQASAISAPSGGATVDAEARTAINSIRTALTNFGMTA